MSEISPVKNSLISAGAGADPKPAKASKDTPEAVEKAASQFESLLIGQLLQSARGSDGTGWMDTDENEAGSTLTEMSEQALSSSLASKGGLGLAKMITNGLQHKVDQTNEAKQ